MQPWGRAGRLSYRATTHTTQSWIHLFAELWRTLYVAQNVPFYLGSPRKMLWMTVEEPALCFGRGWELALLSLRARRMSRQPTLAQRPLHPRHRDTSVTLCNRWHMVAPSLVPARTPAASSTNRVRWGWPMKENRRITELFWWEKTLSSTVHPALPAHR